MSSSIRAIVWSDDRLELLDQRRLPARVEYRSYERAGAVADAIREMVVRGAPAIGIAAAYGFVLAARERYRGDPARWREAVAGDAAELAAARPTAVNLGWALRRMGRLATGLTGDPTAPLLAEARRIHAEDIEANRTMGRLGADLLAAPCDLLTHCNAGALATGGYGTALGVVRTGHAAGKVRRVYAGETRPWLQGARLTAWELVREGIPVSLITDGAAAHAMACGKVQWVIVGADRIAANGDVANKIGTYSLAVLARHHGVGFMVVAPTSTIDPGTPSGDQIPIETRPAEEIMALGDVPIAAPGASAWNPVFDLTPAGLVDALVTERGVVRRPSRDSIASLLAPPAPSVERSV